jgi:hypothetical protein
MVQSVPYIIFFYFAKDISYKINSLETIIILQGILLFHSRKPQLKYTLRSDRDNRCDRATRGNRR